MRSSRFITMIVGLAVFVTRVGWVSAQDLDTLCPGIPWTSSECTEAIERYYLERLENVVWRDGNRLLIRLSTGQVLVLRDSTSGDVSSVRHTYRAYLPCIQRHVIQLHYYEGGSYLLVDARSGKRDAVPGVPVVSPDSSRFVATSVDLEAQYVPTTVQIWRVRDGDVELEWRFDPLKEYRADPYNLWGPQAAEWVTPTMVRVRKKYIDRLGGYVTISLENGDWILRDPDA